MQVDGKTYSSEAAVEFYRLSKKATGEIGVLTLNTLIPLLAVSERKDLLDQGVIDTTDSVSPNIYLAAVYLTKPGAPVLRARCLVRPRSKETIRDYRGRAFRGGSKHEMKLQGKLTFKVELLIDDKVAPTEFELEVNADVNLHSGHGAMTVDWEPGQLLRVTNAEDYDASRKQLFGYSPAGFELTAGRINYNRVLR